MEDYYESKKSIADAIGWQCPTRRDIWELKGSITELAIVTVLFIASLCNGDFGTILGLSIAVTILACILILMDFRELYKKRDFRKLVLFLVGLDCVVLITSSIVLHHWSQIFSGNLSEEQIPVYYSLDGVMLACMILIVLGRLFIRARDRRIAEVEQESLARNMGPPADSAIARGNPMIV